LSSKRSCNDFKKIEGSFTIPDSIILHMKVKRIALDEIRGGGGVEGRFRPVPSFVPPSLLERQYRNLKIKYNKIR